MGAVIFTALMALVLLAGCALVATVTTLALRGVAGGTLRAAAASLALMAGLFLLLGGGDLALPLIALLAHAVALGLIRWRGRGARP